MKFQITVLLATLAISANAAPLQLRADNSHRVDLGQDIGLDGKQSIEIDRRVAPVAAGIFGVAAGSIANAVATGATKGATSGGVRGTINKIFGSGQKRSARFEETQ
ncbi:hypothetical protein M409DRAFT_49084 [Zasmidium cellare ATCC 36951]|uniref:Uncharacterized protein n=1 Tax=Zasmidium cellare ATCC 36951 TaxID=1080233 RepID=A0A6A6D592_ZASCE|nr:uncharacterized protein M409DRAFT_49084 [Zasmidium cellare ATCC 36951]KAF2174225.1 hypothetical protein M409DRAFT_49084 [Zasmidium cellare ATCC 36951]